MLSTEEEQRIEQAFTAFRLAADHAGARAFVLREIARNDEELRLEKERASHRRHRHWADDPEGWVRVGLQRLMRMLAEDWPDLAIDLLAEPAINPWRARLIGDIAQHRPYRGAMVTRALARHKGNGEIISSFVFTALRDKDRELLDAAHRLLGRNGDGIDALVHGYAEMGDLDTAWILATRAVSEHQTSWRVLLSFVREGHHDLPQAALDALARLPGDVERGSMVTELRAAGAVKAADRLAVMLSGAGSGPEHPLAPAMRVVLDDPQSALALAEEAMRQPPLPGAQMRTELELVKFLRLVRLDLATAPRVAALAQLIRAQPVRDEIVARTEAHLAS